MSPLYPESKAWMVKTTLVSIFCLSWIVWEHHFVPVHYADYAANTRFALLVSLGFMLAAGCYGTFWMAYALLCRCATGRVSSGRVVQAFFSLLLFSLALYLVSTWLCSAWVHWLGCVIPLHSICLVLRGTELIWSERTSWAMLSEADVDLRFAGIRRQAIVLSLATTFVWAVAANVWSKRRAAQAAGNSPASNSLALLPRGSLLLPALICIAAVFGILLTRMTRGAEIAKTPAIVFAAEVDPPVSKVWAVLLARPDEWYSVTEFGMDSAFTGFDYYQPAQWQNDWGDHKIRKSMAVAEPMIPDLDVALATGQNLGRGIPYSYLKLVKMTLSYRAAQHAGAGRWEECKGDFKRLQTLATRCSGRWEYTQDFFPLVWVLLSQKDVPGDLLVLLDESIREPVGAAAREFLAMPRNVNAMPRYSPKFLHSWLFADLPQSLPFIEKIAIEHWLQSVQGPRPLTRLTTALSSDCFSILPERDTYFGTEGAVDSLREAELYRLAAMARSRCVRTVLALMGYRKDHGRLPEALPELTPAYLANELPDPFTGQPLRYDATKREIRSAPAVNPALRDELTSTWWRDLYAYRFPEP